MKQPVDFRIPSDDREPIGGEGPKARPATAQADVRQSGSMPQNLINEEILGLGINRRRSWRMLGFIAGTEKQARSFGPNVISDVQIPHKRSITGKESGVAGDEQVSTKGFQREWSGFTAKMPCPRACGIDDDASTNFATRRSDPAHDRSVEDHGFTGAVGDDLKTSALGLRQEVAQESVDVNDSIGGTEERVVKLKPSQKREALPRFVSR